MRGEQLAWCRSAVVALVVAVAAIAGPRAWAGSGMYPFLDEPAMKDPNTTKVLFIGNSFTYFWDMPGMLMKLAASAQPARKLYAGHVTGGGMTLEDHWKGGKALEAIGKYDWDVIVLQKWQERGKDRDLAEYVPKFAEAIHKARPKAKILVYMTESTAVMFGAQTVKQVGSDVDLEKVQKEYEASAKPAGAIIVPASWAWIRAVKEKSPAEQWFWRSNDGHPSCRRQYLTACMMYAAIYEQSPVGLGLREVPKSTEADNPFTEPKGRETLSAEDAQYMQRIAWEAVKEHSGDEKGKSEIRNQNDFGKSEIRNQNDESNGKPK